MSERRGTKGLELWCRRMTEGYPGVSVVNMTTSWRDGLAFCAIIHHFRPDLIDFSKLNKENIYYNNELAFRVAERHLGIPALLEPEDMVEFPVPDRLSILTYLSQFYQAFGVGQGKSSPARTVSKRSATSPEHTLVSANPASPPPKILNTGAGKTRREPCAKCGLPVFIAERLNVGKLLYHRTCFRCARCNSQLTLANYYETENNEFCCETCPDEEKGIFMDSSVLMRSLSDEEKSASLKQDSERDTYSTAFETALEFTKGSSTVDSSQYSKARSYFMSSQVEQGNIDSGNEDEPPDLPKTEPPPRIDNSFSDSGFPNNKQVVNVHTVSGSVDKQEESHDVNTKDAISAEGDTISLVKSRMRLFETKPEAPNETHSVNYQVPLKNSSSAHLENGKENDKEQSKVSIQEASKDNFNSLEPVSSSEEVIKPNEACDDVSKDVPEDSEPVHSTEEVICVNNIKAQIKPNETCDESSVVPEDDSIILISDSDKSQTEGESSVSDTINDISETQSKLEETPQILTISSDLSSIRSPSVVEISDDEETCTPPLEDPSVQKLFMKGEQTKGETEVCNDPKASVKSTAEEYPDELNPFDDGPDLYNPFDEENANPVPAIRKKIKPTTEDKEMSKIYIERVSLNPFGDDDDDEQQQPEIPQPAKRRVITAPKISLNPFWSDDEENEEKPTPKPRVSKSSVYTLEPSPRESMTSYTSESGTHSRKKKLAPRPPASESGASSLTSSPSQSVTHSPRVTPKFRKPKKAPLPPTSTPIEKGTLLPNIALDETFEQEKVAKDEQNRNRQSHNLTFNENSENLTLANKSTYGKWKRRKGQAPSRPVPQRRTIKSLPNVEVRRELELIEMQQQGLERQGVRLEQMIRDKCEVPGVNPDESLAPEIEDMILQLFELVNEKNELFRKQAELMYLRRQQKLEEEHAEIEYQIRCLMLQPEANKTDSDKAKEEELISCLVEIVERRNEIIECLEMDRVREAEEDYSISNQLNLFTLKKEDKSSEKKSKKEKSKHKKEKKVKSKEGKVDADKDIDESENPTSLSKDKKKKKFAIF